MTVKPIIQRHMFLVLKSAFDKSQKHPLIDNKRKATEKLLNRNSMTFDFNNLLFVMIFTTPFLIFKYNHKDHCP